MRPPVLSHLSRQIQHVRHAPPSLRAMVVIACLALLVGFLAYAAVTPFFIGNEKKREMLTLQQQVEAQRKLNARLEKRKNWLNSPEGVIALARKRGMVAPGEEAVHFPPQKAQNPVPITAPAKQDTGNVALGTFLLCGIALLTLALITGIGILLYRRQALRTRRPAGMLTPRSELRKRRRHAHEPVGS